MGAKQTSGAVGVECFVRSSENPTKFPSTQPTTSPSTSPSIDPTTSPSKSPSTLPTTSPSTSPSTEPIKYQRLIRIPAQNSDCKNNWAGWYNSGNDPNGYKNSAYYTLLVKRLKFVYNDGLSVGVVDLPRDDLTLPDFLRRYVNLDY